MLMYHKSDGTLRWFAVLGALAGMLLYRKLVSPYFVKYVSMALNRVLGFLGKAFSILCKPLLFAGRKTKTAAGGVGRLLRQLGRQMKNRLTYFIKKLKMTIKT